MKAQFEKLYQGQNLSRADAKALFDEIFRGGLSDVQLASLLTALKMKGETPDEIGGTGGDGQATINASSRRSEGASAPQARRRPSPSNRSRMLNPSL